jgi:chromosome segregation ATPase
MASRKVDIQISTKADTTGAKTTTDAIDKMVDKVDEAEVAVEDLSQAVDKLDGNLDKVDNSTKVVDRAVDNLTDSVVKLDDRVTDTAQATDKLDDALHVVETSGKGAARSIDAVSQASDKAATSTAKVRKGTASIGVIAQSAGYQVQDFAVQVAGGTSALVAMSQQAPQFLGVFGPGGAIAGALIAVGALAAKVFMGMGDDSASAAEKAAFLEESIKNVSETAAKAVGKDIDFGLKQIDDSTDAALELIGAFDGVTEAANASALASLSNAEKIRKAETEIRKLRGEQVDEMKEIEAATAAESAMREEQARQAIADSENRVKQAKEAEAELQKAFDLKLKEQATAQANLITENQKLGVLREQRDELQKIVDNSPSYLGAFLAGPEGRGDPREGKEAKRQLEDQFFKASIALAEQNIAVLEAKGKEISEQLSGSAKALNSAMTTVAATVQSVALEVPKIEQTLQAGNIVAQVEGIKEAATQAAADVQGIIDQVKPANAAEAAALEALKPMVADKKITADETLRVSQLLGTLDGAIRTQMGTAATNTEKLIQTISTMQQRLDTQQRQIGQLQSSARGSGN